MKEWIISGWLHFAVGVAVTYVVLKKRDWAVAQLKAAWAWIKSKFVKKPVVTTNPGTSPQA